MIRRLDKQMVYNYEKRRWAYFPKGDDRFNTGASKTSHSTRKLLFYQKCMNFGNCLFLKTFASNDGKRQSPFQATKCM